MVKLGIFASILTISAALGYATLSSSPVSAADAPCKRTVFATKLVKEACATGGQKAAKAAMKTWLKDAKAKNPKISGCPVCHAKVGGDFPLKKDGLKLFTDAGGELVAGGKTPMAPTPKPAPKPAPAPTPTK
jgi:hypothetical protein